MSLCHYYQWFQSGFSPSRYVAIIYYEKWSELRVINCVCGSNPWIYSLSYNTNTGWVVFCYAFRNKGLPTHYYLNGYNQGPLYSIWVIIQRADSVYISDCTEGLWYKELMRVPRKLADTTDRTRDRSIDSFISFHFHTWATAAWHSRIFATGMQTRAAIFLDNVKR